jgi:enterochelin esterase-like enzyme
MASASSLVDTLQEQLVDSPVGYNKFNGGHEALCWRGSVAEGLVALMGTRQGSR